MPQFLSWYSFGCDFDCGEGTDVILENGMCTCADKTMRFDVDSKTCVDVSLCTESFDRRVKDFTSDYGGGLYRRVSVYDYNGNLVKTWEGKFDTQMGDTSGVPYVKFDIPDNTGKKVRVIVQGGIIINEEL